MNETLTTIAKRYSCRKYTAQKPDRQTLQTIAEAAVQSPSGMNRQPWRIHVVTNEAILADMETSAMDALRAMEDQSIYQRFMERGGTVFYNAPCMMIVTAPEGNDMDCGIVSENIALAAASLGLGNVICGMARLCFSDETAGMYEKRIGFADGERFAIAVLIGYADGETAPHAPDLSKIAFVE